MVATLRSGEVVTLAHGSGGKATRKLVEELFARELSNPLLDELGDAAVADGLAFTTDSFVVKPLFFPGGDIGELAVNGTVNDLAVAGAEPLWLSAAFVIEEGFPLDDLRRIVQSMARAAEHAGVAGRRRRHEGGRARERRRPLRHDRRRRAHAGDRSGGRSRATACSSPARSATTASPCSSPAAISASRPHSRATPRRSTG